MACKLLLVSAQSRKEVAWRRFVLRSSFLSRSASVNQCTELIELNSEVWDLSHGIPNSSERAGGCGKRKGMIWLLLFLAQ